MTYGILLVLTFTGTLRVAARAGEDLGSTLWAAAGCCLAWAVADGCMYAFNCLASRNRSFHLLKVLREHPDSARQEVAAALPEPLVGGHVRRCAGFAGGEP